MYARGKRTKRASIDARNDRSRGRALRLFTSSCIRVALFLTAGDLYFPPEPTTFSPDWAHCPWRRSWLRVALTSRIESEPRAPVPRLFRSGHRPDSLHLYALHAPQAGRNRFCGCCRRPSVPRRCSSVLCGHSIPVICGFFFALDFPCIEDWHGIFDEFSMEGLNKSCFDPDMEFGNFKKNILILLEKKYFFLFFIKFFYKMWECKIRYN